MTRRPPPTGVPTLLVLTSDPADAVRLRRALDLLARRARECGGPRPRIADAAVVHANTADHRPGPPPRDGSLSALDGADMSPLLLATDEAARRLGLGQRTVERLVAEGRIASRKVGTRRYFTESDLAAYVETTAAPRPQQDSA